MHRFPSVASGNNDQCIGVSLSLAVKGRDNGLSGYAMGMPSSSLNVFCCC